MQSEPDTSAKSPWAALWALVVGFFMILVDTTIVSVATPALKTAFDADVASVLWVTSAYLLAYVVPLLIMGRLGDRVGPKRVYLVGLTIFTISSLACGLTSSLGGLVAARAVQGFGASMMTPQTMSVITRLFAPDRRGRAMALWGAVAGAATLVGPLAGGVLVGTLGWEWIFFVNVPIGVVAFALVWRFVPNLPVRRHRFDWLGVALNGLGLFCIVFGLQEATAHRWGTIWGPVTVWNLIITGCLLLAAFLVWQHFNRGEPLLPLGLFRDRNFAVSNSAVALVGFAATGMPFALMLWAQSARGLPPMQAALITAPSALVNLLLASWVGSLVDRIHPRLLTCVGAAAWCASLLWVSACMNATTPIWQVYLPMTLMGLGQTLVWGPLATAAQVNLPREHAGAGSGVYNTTRQMGAVLGSAVAATVLSSRLAANLPGMDQAVQHEGAGQVPADIVAPYAAAMSETILVPAAAMGLAFLVMLLFERPRHQRRR